MDLFIAYQFTRREHWQNVARKMTRWTGWGGPYRKRLNQVVKSLAVPGLRVLELGCGRGDLLATVARLDRGRRVAGPARAVARPAHPL